MNLMVLNDTSRDAPIARQHLLMAYRSAGGIRRRRPPWTFSTRSRFVPRACHYVRVGRSHFTQQMDFCNRIFKGSGIVNDAVRGSDVSRSRAHYYSSNYPRGRVPLQTEGLCLTRETGSY